MKGIKIKGVTYKLYYISSDCIDYYGFSNTGTKEIFLAENLNKEKLYETIFHELIHCYFYECGLFKYCNDETLVTWLDSHFVEINKKILEVVNIENR